MSLSPDCNVYALDVKVGVATGCTKGAYVEDTSPDVTNVPDEEGNVKAEDEEDLWDKMKLAGTVFFDKIKNIFK